MENSNKVHSAARRKKDKIDQIALTIPPLPARSGNNDYSHVFGQIACEKIKEPRPKQKAPDTGNVDMDDNVRLPLAS